MDSGGGEDDGSGGDDGGDGTVGVIVIAIGGDEIDFCVSLELP